MALPRYTTREERAEAQRRSEVLKLLGKPLMVLPEEAAAAVALVHKARKYGMSDQNMCDQVGLSWGAIYKVRRGLTKGMHRTTYEAIMSLRPQAPTCRPTNTQKKRIPGGARRDATTTRRRIRALRADGFSNRTLGTFLDCSAEAVSGLARDERPTVCQTTYQAISDLYDKLAGTDPADLGTPKCAVSYARAWGVKQGWAPSRCWDADTIDDPKAFPEWTGACGTIQGRAIHNREGIPMCQPCKKATASLARERYGYIHYTFEREKFVRLMDNSETTKQVLADRLGIHRETVGSWRTGLRSPGLENTERIAEFFGVHISELRTEVERDDDDASVQG